MFHKVHQSSNEESSDDKSKYYYSPKDNISPNCVSNLGTMDQKYEEDEIVRSMVHQSSNEESSDDESKYHTYYSPKDNNNSPGCVSNLGTTYSPKDNNSPNYVSNLGTMDQKDEEDEIVINCTKLSIDDIDSDSETSESKIVEINCYRGKCILDISRVHNYLTPTLQKYIIREHNFDFLRDDLNINTRDFSAFITFLCTGYISIRLDILVLVAEKLGGSKKLDNYLKYKLDQNIPKPNCPSDDIQELYNWKIAYATKGYEDYVPTKPIHGNSIQYWFRKRKN
jgi:hypothetical protein